MQSRNYFQNMQKVILHLFVAGLMRFVFGTSIAGLAHDTTLTPQILDVTKSNLDTVKPLTDLPLVTLLATFKNKLLSLRLCMIRMVCLGKPNRIQPIQPELTLS
jgi:hypothetical protein